MEKAEWEKLIHEKDNIAEIDIRVTPLAHIARSVEVVGCFIEKSVDGNTIISIFRYDPNDAPQVINLDKYMFWETLGHPIVYSPIVISCSTCDDTDFRGFLDDYVCIVPMPKGEDHHLEELPDKYKKSQSN